MKQHHKTTHSSARASIRQRAPDRPDLDAERLAHVQHILGHKAPETTLAFYAEINEGPATDCWQAYLADNKSGSAKGFRKKGRR